MTLAVPKTALLGIATAATFLLGRPIVQAMPLVLTFILVLFDPRALRDLGRFWWIAAIVLVLGVLNVSSPWNMASGVANWFGGLLMCWMAYYLGDQIGTRRYVRWLLWFTLVQLPIGVFQIYQNIGFAALNPFDFIGGAAGDAFGGTLGVAFTNSHIVALKFATLMCVMLIAVRHFVASAFGRAAALSALVVGFLLPSALHSILCLIAAAGMFVLQSWRTVPQNVKRTLVFAVLVIVLLLALTQRQNIDYVLTIASSLSEEEALMPRKVLALRDAVVRLPDMAPMAPFIGVGLGNYCSYGAMVLTPDYLAGRPDFLPVSYTPYTKEFVLPYWNAFMLVDPFQHGTHNQPWFSYMSAYAEAGSIGIALFVGFFVWVLSRLSGSARSSDMYVRDIARGLILCTWLLLFLFIFDNWFEDARLMVPYFILLGLFLRETAHPARVVPVGEALQ